MSMDDSIHRGEWMDGSWPVITGNSVGEDNNVDVIIIKLWRISSFSDNDFKYYKYS